jgi:hypothetical protein
MLKAKLKDSTNVNFINLFFGEYSNNCILGTGLAKLWIW